MSARRGYVISHPVHPEEGPDDAVSAVEVCFPDFAEPAHLTVRIIDGGDVETGDELYVGKDACWRFLDRPEGRIKRVYLRLAGRVR